MEYASDFQNGISYVYDGNFCDDSNAKGYLINKVGKILRKNIYMEHERPNFSEGLTIVKTDSGFAYLSCQGKLLIPKYNFAKDDESEKGVITNMKNFNGGIGMVQIDYKYWGSINHLGEWEIKPQYYEMELLKNGFYKVKTDRYGRDFYTDRNGRPYNELENNDTYD